MMNDCTETHGPERTRRSSMANSWTKMDYYRPYDRHGILRWLRTLALLLSPVVSASTRPREIASMHRTIKPWTRTTWIQSWCKRYPSLYALVPRKPFSENQLDISVWSHPSLWSRNTYELLNLSMVRSPSEINQQKSRSVQPTKERGEVRHREG